MKPLFRWVLDSVLPPSCLVCSEPVEAEGQLCLDCFRKANFISPPLCAHCGVPLAFAQPEAGTQPLCAACEAAPPAFDMARAALRYDDIAKRMILPLKYSDQSETAAGLARLMRRPGEEMLQAANLLVPVPLHAARLRQRRYNQAAVLAIALARLTGRPLGLDALRRDRATKPLEKLGPQERRAELVGAISLREDANVAGKRVLLIDDVMTTGATANQCALALRGGGAARVDVLTVARVADPRLL
ncbi:ComF family protein [Acidocella sp.]|uniref:ComF family protein n=1 Tax=Acidocella sp. TaxID=50710 RepID=UPI003CFEF01C